MNIYIYIVHSNNYPHDSRLISSKGFNSCTLPSLAKRQSWLSKCNWSKPKNHDDVIKRKHFPRYWPVVRGIPSQRPGPRSFYFSLICAWTNVWAINKDAGDLRRHLDHNNVTVLKGKKSIFRTRLVVNMTVNKIDIQQVKYRFSCACFTIAASRNVLWCHRQSIMTSLAERNPSEWKPWAHQQFVNVVHTLFNMNPMRVYLTILPQQNKNDGTARKWQTNC